MSAERLHSPNRWRPGQEPLPHHLVSCGGTLPAGSQHQTLGGGGGLSKGQLGGGHCVTVQLVIFVHHRVTFWTVSMAATAATNVLNEHITHLMLF